MKHTRVAHMAGLVLALTCGCVRLGYDSKSPARNPKPDASHEDAGKRQNDGGASDASGSDANGMDASKQDASMLDGGPDAGKQDASMLDAGPDAGKQDSGSSDSGLQDSGSSDSGPLDSGSEDAALQDADVDSGPLPTKWCPERNDAVICDDFELNSLSRWEYPVIANGTVGITTAEAHSGTHSFVATTDPSSMAGNNQARRGTKAFPHVTSGEIWLRYFYFVPNSVSINSGFSTCPLAEVEMPYLGFALHIRPTTLEIGVLGMAYPGMPPMAFPRGVWVCVETRAVIDPTQGRFEAYVNGALVVQTPEIDTLPDMGYSSVDIGIHYTNPSQGAVTAYVDDVIAGYKRFGCN